MLCVLHLHAIVSVTGRARRIIQAIDAFCHIGGFSRAELLHGTHRIVKSGLQPASFWDLTALLAAANAAGKCWSHLCDWPVTR